MADRDDIHPPQAQWSASSAASLSLSSSSSPSAIPLEPLPPSLSSTSVPAAGCAPKTELDAVHPASPSPHREQSPKTAERPNRPSAVRSVHYDDYPDDPEDYNLEVFNRLESDGSRDRDEDEDDEFDPFQTEDWLAGTTSQTQHLRTISSSLEDLQSSIVTLCTRSSEQGRLLKSHSSSVKKASAQLEDVWTALLRIVAQQDALQTQISELKELVARSAAR